MPTSRAQMRAVEKYNKANYCQIHVRVFPYKKAAWESFLKKSNNVGYFPNSMNAFIVDCVDYRISLAEEKIPALYTTVRWWGNSSAVKAVSIPRQILSQANIEEGTDVEIIVKEGEITLRAVRKQKKKQKNIRELFADYEGGFFQTEEIDMGKRHGEEVW